MSLELILENIKRFNKRVKEIGNGRYVYFWFSFIFCVIFFGSSFNDYFLYEFYKKSNSERRKFFTFNKNMKTIKTYNDSDFLYKVKDKRMSHKIFKDYIKRDWLDTSICTFDEFKEFLNKHEEVIIKPNNKHSGEGIHKYSYNPSDNLLDKFNSIKGSVVEEVLVQHQFMNNLNPTSVNTIRVGTFLHNGEVNLLGCSIILGKGNAVVNNFHDGGMVATIDIDTGIIITPSVDMKLDKYIIHPFTNEQIIGKKVPYWEEIINTVKEAALLIPELKYIGWDIVIIDDGVALLEGNHDQGLAGIQLADQIGKYQLVKEIISKDK